jgi:type III secretory pathway lipoprotein EscJ
MERLITIKAYLGPVEASMMHSILESEDVYSFLKDENSVIMAPYLSNAIGGIKLQVRESDVQKAVDILQEAGYLKEEPETAESGLKSRVVPVIILFALLAALAL